jgi:hypothetical protein
MRKPDENLDEYIVTPDPESSSKAPRAVSLQRTGEIQLLKPLTLRELRAKRRSHRRGLYQPLWFRRFLILGSGALVSIALVMVSAIFIAINDPVEPDIATNVKMDEVAPQPGQPFSFELFSPSNFAPATAIVDAVRSKTARKLTRSRVHTAVRTRRPSTPAPQLEQSEFVPTTLVIYAENGVINTRIEPWLQDRN